MKLATLNDGSRDGQLVVVSRDLTLALHASAIATRLQQVLDDWNFLSPQLEAVYATLNAGKARHAFAFDPLLCMAPLPRCFEWAAGRGDHPPTAPLHTRSGNAWLGPRADIAPADADAVLHCTPGLAVITGDIERGADATQALAGVRLLMLVGDWTLRRDPAGEPTPAADPPPSHLATAAGPVAVTPDELGVDWRDGRVRLPLQHRVNECSFGSSDADSRRAASFGLLLAQLARDRALCAGCIVGSLHTDGPEHDPLHAGDRICIELGTPVGQGLLGRIEQHVGGTAARADIGP